MVTVAFPIPLAMLNVDETCSSGSHFYKGFDTGLQPYFARSADQNSYFPRCDLILIVPLSGNYKYFPGSDWELTTKVINHSSNTLT